MKPHALSSLLLALALAAPGVSRAQDQPLPPRRPPMPFQERLPFQEGTPRQENTQPRAPRTEPRSAKPEAAKTPESKGPPPLPTDPAKRLEALFERLRDAENNADAKKAEAEIEKLFERSGSATADLMFARSTQALAARDLDLALDLLDYITALKPDFAEAYHRRALVHVMRKDEEAALRDLKLTLGMQPRHFQALAGLGGLLRSLGDKKGAYKALTRVRELNPRFPDIGETLEKMRLDVEGQPI